MIVGGSASSGLAKKISSLTGERLAKVEYKKFPDNEIYLRLLERPEKNATIVQSTHFPQYENFIELLFLADLLRENGAERINAVIPYLLHARQDKKFEEGELVTSETISKILKASGIKSVITVDCHYYRKEGEFDMFGLPGYNVSGARAIVDYFGEKYEDLTIITPDVGASETAKMLGGKSLKKRRISSYEVEIEGLPDVSGKNVLILDDMITTGGTMLRAIKKIKGHKPQKILVAATHAAFCKGAYEKIKPLVDELVCTDTIPHECSKVSVAGIISEAIKKW